jgi:hypothetical protein
MYPIGGAVIGGGIGSIGGPGGAALGAGAGAAVGEILEGDGELKDVKEEVVEAREVIQALSSGDVDKLVQKKLEEQKDAGFFDSILDGIYNILFIAAIIITLWIAIPMWYTHYVVKKKIKKEESK